MIIVYIIIGLIWIFLAFIVLSAMRLSSRFDRKFEDMAERAGTQLAWEVRALENHKQITRPSSQVLATIRVHNE